MEDVMPGSGRSIAAISTPKDRVCTVKDLQLQSGDWYFIDGIGREHGPVSFSDIRLLVDQGAIHKHSSVFRKSDNIWVPATPSGEISDASASTNMENNSSFGSSSGTCLLLPGGNNLTSSFHGMHPQFIGFMRGKLHELVMRSYKSREFTAAINEVLDPWINAKQPKKEMDKPLYRKSDPDHHASKRPRISIEDDDYSDVEEGFGAIQMAEMSFEDLCEGASFCKEENEPVENHMHSWGFLDGHILARVYHFLRFDVRSLAFASSTCKHWRSAVVFYKGISRLVDFSSLGPKCTDSMLLSALNGYHNGKINAIVLRGCTNVSEDTLREVIRTFPCLSDVDIRGCNQLVDFPNVFPSMNWRNTFNFLVPKVAKIQDRIRHGYYSRNGIGFAKADIDRICRDAIKVRSRGDAGDMNYIISLFIQLATRLDESSKAAFQRDGHLNQQKDEPSEGFLRLQSINGY
ncbi:hypothetical protein MLD38_009142 [Melastoma candidum]|uniref:Uncharacterized protein n=1 Tax=Melastoma candidum TaxID=119954 RepID=A0ACB9RZN1_9MYRT|nr:hypothetical protein MLD38_009142 [Melastoma candidum]